MNLKIKFRESFRPFAPAVLLERVSDFFEMREKEYSPYMLLVAPVVEKERRELTDDEKKLKGIEKLKTIRSSVPSITHVDYSARVQTVGEDNANPRYRRLIQKFEEKTGVPLVVNTSFNVRGEPIVRTPEESYRCFMATHMDVLVMENFVLLKEEQPAANRQEIESYLASAGTD